MELAGTLVIRWRERGGLDLSLVLAGTPTPAAPVPVRRLGDADELRDVLTELGLAPDRVARLVASPYALQSVPVHVDRRAAAREGLIAAGPVERALALLATAVTEPTRLVRRVVPGQARRRPS